MAGSRGGFLSWRGRVASSDGAWGKRHGGAHAGGGAELAGCSMWLSRWRRRRTALPWARCREARGRRNGQWQFCNFLEVQNPVM